MALQLALVAVFAAAIAVGAPGAKANPNPLGLLTGVLEWFGELGVFCRRVSKSLFTLPFEWDEFLHQFDAAGAKSAPLVALAGAATGVVMSLQTRDTLTRFGAKSFLPSMIVYSLVKEMGPIIT
jgi:phospholipid/cholesterol/gamma-HCH transport system permease protein